MSVQTPSLKDRRGLKLSLSVPPSSSSDEPPFYINEPPRFHIPKKNSHTKAQRKKRINTMSIEAIEAKTVQPANIQKLQKQPSPDSKNSPDRKQIKVPQKVKSKKVNPYNPYRTAGTKTKTHKRKIKK